MIRQRRPSSSRSASPASAARSTICPVRARFSLMVSGPTVTRRSVFSAAASGPGAEASRAASTACCAIASAASRSPTKTAGLGTCGQHTSAKRGSVLDYVRRRIEVCECAVEKRDGASADVRTGAPGFEIGLFIAECGERLDFQITRDGSFVSDQGIRV